MYHITNRGRIINEEVILLLEALIKCSRLPNDYRNFLLEFNGGEVEPFEFNFKDKDYGSDIQSFFKINSNDHNDWLQKYKLFKGRIPKNFIPVASDSGGNLILLSIKDKDRNKIFFWDHEYEVDTNEIPSYSNLTLITNNFSEFLNSLY